MADADKDTLEFTDVCPVKKCRIMQTNKYLKNKLTTAPGFPERAKMQIRGELKAIHETGKHDEYMEVLVHGR